jgi:hypothetical protein
MKFERSSGILFHHQPAHPYGIGDLGSKYFIDWLLQPVANSGRCSIGPTGYGDSP